MKNRSNIFWSFIILFTGLFIFMGTSTSRFFPAASSQTAYAQNSDEKKPGRTFTHGQLEKMDVIKKAVTDEGWRHNNEDGFGFSITKIAILLVLFWCWIATSSWASADTERLGDLYREKWCMSVVFPFILCFPICILVPIYWIGMPLLFVSWLLPIWIYIGHRNKGVLAADKVMTFDHLMFLFATKVLKKKVKPKPLPYEIGDPIQFRPMSKKLSDEQKNGILIKVRNMPGYNTLRKILYNALHRNAQAVIIDFRAEETLLQYQLDGLWHPINNLFKRPLSREDGDQLNEATKILAITNPQDRRNKQSGIFKIEYDKKMKCEADFMSQGTPTGEQFMIIFKGRKIMFKTLASLGASPEREKEIKTLINADKGLVILSAQHGQGLNTFTNVVFNTADRFTRDFSTVEDVQKGYEQIENIQLNQYDSEKGETPMTVLPDVFFREPKVLLLREMKTTDAFTLCCEEVSNDRLIITTFRGRDSAETLMRMLQTGIDPKLFADSLIAIITQRLVRRLCPDCKEEIPANPQIIQRLGLPAGSVKTLYRKRVRPQLEPGQKDTYIPCETCSEIGYQDRIAIFDILEINDELRQIISTRPSVEAIRKAAIKSGQRGFMVDGARLIAEGITSLDELSRALK